LGDATTLARTLMSRALALDGPDFGDAMATADEVVQIGEAIGETDLILQGLRVRTSALLAAGRPQEARQLAASFTRLAEGARHQEHTRMTHIWELFWAAFEGRYDDVEQLADQAADQHARAGHPHAALVPFADTMVPRWLHGRLDLARPAVELLCTAAPETDVWRAQSIWVDTATGNVEQALARLDEHDPQTVLARVPRDLMWWPTLMPWALVASHGHRRWAEALHAVMLPYTGRLVVAGYALFGGTVDHHLGTLALVLDRTDEAVERLERALDRHRALGAPGFVGLSAGWLARALRRRGHAGDERRTTALLDELDLLIEHYGLHGLRGLRGPGTGDGVHDRDHLSVVGPR
jgi:hypothetical protein